MSASPTLRSLLNSSPLPTNEARILLAHILEKYYQLPRSALLSRDDMMLHAAAQEEWQRLEQRRMHGEPVAYILGKKGFHNIELSVAPGVLIPRPETELLVEIALNEISKINQKVSILDLGTGSGAIALAIASASTEASLLATDQSKEALAIAIQNTKSLKLTHRVQFAHGSWYQAVPKDSSFDIILSNPPYIADQDPHLEQGDLRFEPSSALTDQASGLTCLEEIIAGASIFLKPGGLIAVEHGFDQADVVVALMINAGLKDPEIHLDLAGHSRVSSARKSI